MLIIVLQRRVLHILLPRFVTFSLYKTQSKIIFHSLLLVPFVDSYYSPPGPQDRMPGRFYYHKFTGFWLNLGTVNTESYIFGMLRRHIRLVWSRHGYFGLTASRHSSTKLAEAFQKGTIRYKSLYRASFLFHILSQVFVISS